VTGEQAEDEPSTITDYPAYTAKLLGMIHSDDPGTRAYAVERLTDLLVDDVVDDRSAVVGEIVASLEDGNVDVQTAAVEAVGEIGQEAIEAVPRLLELLKSKKPDLRKKTVVAIGKLRPPAPVVLPGLIKVLSDKVKMVQYAAVDVIGRYGEEAEPAVPALLKIAKNEKPPKCCITAFWALGQIGSVPAAKLVPMLKSGNEYVRSHAANLLSGIAPLDETVVSAIRKLLSHSSPGIRITVLDLAESHEQLKSDPEIIEAVLKSLKSPVARVREAALYALQNMDVDEATLAPKIKPLLDDEDEDVREAAEWMLASDEDG